MKKELGPNLRPEKQHTIPKQGSSEKLWVGQGRAGLRRRRPDHINKPSDVTQGIRGGSKIETGKGNSSQGTNSVHDRAINCARAQSISQHVDAGQLNVPP